MDHTVSDEKLHELNLVVGEKGGTIPSEVSEALRKAQIAQAVGAPIALTAALNEAIAANIKNGAAWSDVQFWLDTVKGTGGVDPGTPPTPGPTPESFTNRTAFDTWAATAQQQVNLDGVKVHDGFGPAMNWYTQADGSITQAMPGTGGTDPVVTPPPTPIPPPSGVQAFPQTQESTESTRHGRMTVGQVYAVTLGKRSRVTCNSNGQGFHWASKEPNFPNDESKTQAAMGTSPPLICDAGLVYVKLGEGFFGSQYDGNIGTQPV